MTQLYMTFTFCLFTTSQCSRQCYIILICDFPSPQTEGAGHVWRHWGDGQCEMGAGFVSSGLLGVHLLQYLEKCQILCKGDILS